MKLRKSLAYMATLLSVVALSFASGAQSVAAATKQANLPLAYNNKKAAKKGGTLKIGYVSDSAFKGIFNDGLSDDANDSAFAQFGDMPLFKTDDNYKFVKGGAADISFDQNAKTATITINPKVKWSDGQPLVAKDIVYSYEIIANKDSGSSRYTDSLKNIEGMEEYHEGKADSISGLEIKDDHTLVIHFKEMKPGMTTSGSGYIWEFASPYHYLKDVPFKDLQSSDKIRKAPLYYGPYMIKKIVQGESIEWVPNPYYFGKKPKFDKITIETVSPSSASAALKSKKYDILWQLPSSVYGKNKKVNGYVYTGKQELAYTYLAFKVGKFDNETSKNVMDKNAKMNNRSLRQAIAYAMNIQQVSDKFGYGLKTRATTLIPPAFGDYHDKSVKGYAYNLKKANNLLDKAGYKKGKDGYRTDPNGKKLTIYLAAMSGSADQEAIIKNYIQQWKKVGLRVKLVNGRLLDFNNFYDKVQNDVKGIDMFMGAWSLSSEPSPNDLYSEGAPYNMSRFVSKENNTLLANIDSAKSFNTKYRIKQFYKWQEYMNKEAYVVPMQYYYDATPVAKNIKGYTNQVSKSYYLWENVSFSK